MGRARVVFITVSFAVQIKGCRRSGAPHRLAFSLQELSGRPSRQLQQRVSVGQEWEGGVEPVNLGLRHGKEGQSQEAQGSTVERGSD